MTTKVICDGCDRDITRTTYEQVTVCFGASVTQRFDLCGPCKDKFKRALPDHWARYQPEGKEPPMSYPEKDMGVGR